MRVLIVTALICAAVIEGALCMGQVNQVKYEKPQQEVSVDADVIEARFRIHNGKRQYRHSSIDRYYKPGAGKSVWSSLTSYWVE